MNYPLISDEKFQDKILTKFKSYEIPNKKPSFLQTKRVYMNRKHNYRRTHRHRNIK